MKDPLHTLFFKDFKAQNGKTIDLTLSYQIFGKPLHTAPVVLINHALTGNSNVTGDDGWWKKLVGDHQPIDTTRFTVLAFNVPGNGFDDFFIDDYTVFKASDIAKAFLDGLESLKIKKLFALVGGSVGGAIGWEMLAINPQLTEIFIPIATDHKTTDWLHSECLVQQFLLESESQPLEKARIHAMLCYRTPESLNGRFNREKLADNALLKSHDWLNFHGRSLGERFSLKAYRLMNHLLMNIDVSEENLKKIQAEIHLIAVDSDLFFPALEIKKTYDLLKENEKNIFYHEIKSVHGHDAFLMEYDQMKNILNPIFN